jgi:hypothetical protein
MSIFKETFKKGVENQLKARQEAITERTPDAIQYFNSRNAWIRMTSAVEVGGSGELARNYVLLGGTLYNGKLRSGVGSGNEAYSTKSPGGATHRLGIRPMPGITSIDVKSKSAYGSLREVEVKFQAWDLRQLEDLELLYMRPGYSVLVEWGWAPYLNNSKKLESNINFVDSVLNGGPTKEEIWKEIYNKSANNGNYDAIYGFIKNYSWSARADGGYDCSTTLITMGEILESLKVNYGPYQTKPPDKSLFGVLDASYFQKDTIISKAYNQNIIAGICSELYETIKKQITTNTTEGTFNGWTFYRFNVDIAGKDPGNTIVSEGAQIYITLKDFVSILNKYVLISDTKAQKPLLELSVYCGDHNGGTTTPLTCLGDIQQLSTDPSICLIKNINWTSPSSYLGIEVSTANLAITKKIMETLSQDYWYNGDFTKQQLGVIGNIYVNLDYIYSLVTNPNVAAQDKKEKNDIALFDFIKTMMSGINASIGSVATFELFLDPVDSIARIIDVNYTGNREEDWAKAVTIEIQKLGSVVRSYKLESQIFPEQSTMVAIGAQAQGGALGENVNTMVDFNQNLIDRIIPKKDSPLSSSSSKTAADTEAENKEKEKIRKENLSILIDYISKIDPDFWESKGDFDAGEASKYSNALKDQINYYRSNTEADNKNRAIIPTKLSIEMDGIGGIIIGNIFKIPEEILPRGYKGGGAGPSKIGYVVTGIGHLVQGNDWKTNIDAQFIILDPPKKGISTANSKAIKAGNRAAQSPTKSDRPSPKNPKDIEKKPVDRTQLPGPPSKDIPPNITVDKVIAAMQRKNYVIYANTAFGRNKLNLVGIREKNKAFNSPVSDFFNDYVVMFYYDSAGRRQERIGFLTTTPGLFYELEYYGNGNPAKNYKGTRTVVMKEGQWIDKFYKGLHKSKPALVQITSKAKAKVLLGLIDYHKDDSLNATYNDVAIISGEFATNIHSSGQYGPNDPKKKVGRWSGGCQVLRSYDDYLWMMQAAKNQLDNTGYKFFNYTLLNIADIK